MNKILSFLTATAALWALWMALVGNAEPQELIAGLLVAAAVAVIAGAAPFTGASLRILQPRRLAAAVAYIPYLLLSIVRSNLDVARRVIAPSLPIRPGIVRVRTRLTHPVSRLLLANSITLTPGTLTVDLCDDELCIHWVDVRTDDIEGATAQIVSGFERFLEVIFD